MRREDYVGNAVQERKLLSKTKDDLERGDKTIAQPGQVKVAAQGNRPNFAKPTRSYKTSTSTAGDVDALVYRSYDGSLEYVVFKDAENHIWFQSVSVVDAKVTAHGVQDQAIDPGALCTPLWEYREEMSPDYWGRTNPRQPKYVSTWKYLSSMEEIRAWYQATGVRMPEGER
jgi:hypothetical protein